MTYVRAFVAALAVTATLTAGGCAAPGEDRKFGATPTISAVPPGVRDPAPALSGTAGAGKAPECDARESLRPRGPRPIPGGMPAGSTMDSILRRGRLIVGVDQNAHLFGFRDPVTGELQGLDLDLAYEISEAIFGSRDHVQFKAIILADRIPAVRDKSVDMVIYTMTMTCERWRAVAFSTEYLTAGQRVLVNRGSNVKGLADLTGRKVCAPRETTSLESIQLAQGPVPVSADTTADCLVLLQQGQVDAISTDDVVLAGLAAQDPFTEVVGEPFTQEPYGIAMSQDSLDLVRFVNGVLEDLRANGELKALYVKWLESLKEQREPPVARYRD
jgi:polar amino acid transport system substrate-binding protein